VDQSPVTILIIDGDAASRKYLSVMLQKEGYRILTASLGREGLISAWKDQPGIIIFDPILPDLAGAELMTRLRQDRRTANVPCVALSGRENVQEMSSLLAAGCNEYLVKSGDALARLIQFLSRLLNRDSSPSKRGKLFVFLSAKGGSGTSSLCANLAMCIGSNRMDKHVAVVDMVLPIGSIANIVG
jgi:PleD family two-component response regulator